MNRNHILFIVCLFFGIISFFGVNKIRFEYDLTKFYEEGKSDVEFYNQMKSEFNTSDEMILVGIESDQKILSKEVIPKLDTLTMMIQSLPAVNSVSSLTTIQNYVKTPLGVFSHPFIHKNNLDSLPFDERRLSMFKDIYPKFLSDDQKATCLYVYYNKGASQISNKIDSVLTNYNFSNAHILGGDLAKQNYELELKKDVRFLSIVSGILIVIFLLVVFRSFKIIFSAVLVISLTLLYTVGVMGFLNVPLNLITAMMPCVVAILCLSDIVHIVNRFKETQPQSNDEIKSVINKVQPSIFFTSLTTLIGFLSLLISGVIPFIQFGIIVSIGIVIAYLLSIYLLPICLKFSKLRSTKTYKGNTRGANVIIYFLKFPWLTIGIFLLLMGLSIMSSFNVKEDSYTYDNINSKDKLSSSLRFFENKFFGIRSDEIIVESNSNGILNEKVINEIDKIENYLISKYSAKDVYSINTEFKRYHRIIAGGNPEDFKLPESLLTGTQLLKAFSTQRERSLIDAGVLSKDADKSKIWIKSKDWGSWEARQKLEGFRAFVKNEINEDVIQVTFTGHSYLIDQANTKITSFLLLSLSIAILIVVGISGLLYKSFRIAIIALLPNVIPIVALLGLMGMLNVGLNLGTAIVFTIAFGIGVDDTIHYLIRFKEEYKRVGKEEALIVTSKSTGRAIIVTSVILMLGFGVLTLSSFQSTVNIGFLTSITLGIALLCDLILLPSLLKVFYK